MRYQGKITDWKDEQGFGFITQNGGDQRLFLHIKSFSQRVRRPSLGDAVTYTVSVDQKGRGSAQNVAFLNQLKKMQHTRRLRRANTWPLYCAALFCVFIALLVVFGKLYWQALAFYASVNLITWVQYLIDKKAAQNAARRRTAEIRLHLLGLAGGWPGALLAQRMLRHKSSKQSFQEAYWATVIIHCCALGWLLSPFGKPVLNWLNGIAA